MTPPKIGILIPTYEPSPAHLCAALDSVLAQTETRWSILVHDDCSPTDVATIVGPYLRDPRITFVRSPVRLGIGGNWNACLGVALGAKPDVPFVQFLFQDDLLDPPYLERALRAFRDFPDAGFAALEHRYVFEGAMITVPAYDAVRAARKEIRAGRHDGREFLRAWVRRELHPNLVGEPSFVMLRRNLIEHVGSFAPDMPQFLDVEYWVRCLIRAPFVWIADVSGSFRVHAKAASARNEESGAGVMDRLRCFERLITELPQGTLRDETIAARTRALTTMARKFLWRIRSGRGISGTKGGALRAFAVRHPFLCMRALTKALITRTA